MLEKHMEEAVANCPGLFIEPGLTLVRRQVVINGRRPDVLFSDVLSRHLLVEIQRGRLDENHLQRHFYYSGTAPISGATGASRVASSSD
jgi:hypothetical protein